MNDIFVLLRNEIKTLKENKMKTNNIDEGCIDLVLNIDKDFTIKKLNKSRLIDHLGGIKIKM